MNKIIDYEVASVKKALAKAHKMIEMVNDSDDEDEIERAYVQAEIFIKWAEKGIKSVAHKLKMSESELD